MKKSKILLPALGMLLLSTAASVTGTVAWFAANSTVEANGMTVKVKSQEGLVISNAATGTYNASAASTITATAELLPGSTRNLTDWFASTSNDPASANTSNSYTTATAWTSSAAGNYIVHDFYIRSSAAAALTIGSLNVTKVEAKKLVTTTVEGVTSTTMSDSAQNISKALRVGVKFNSSSNSYIYAPIAGATTYSVTKAEGAYASANMVEISALAGTTTSKDTSITSIPANNASGLNAKVYIWFEGEDANCISNNILAELENLAVVVTFGYTAA